MVQVLQEAEVETGLNVLELYEGKHLRVSEEGTGEARETLDFSASLTMSQGQREGSSRDTILDCFNVVSGRVGKGFRESSSHSCHQRSMLPRKEPVYVPVTPTRPGATAMLSLAGVQIWQWISDNLSSGGPWSTTVPAVGGCKAHVHGYQRCIQ